MCGRFTLSATGPAIAAAFGLPEPPIWRPRFNIAPAQTVPVLLRDAGATRLLMMLWGWTGPGSDQRLLINARSETVDQKPTFRDSFRTRRCLVVADGFYEWAGGGPKVPYFFRLEDGGPFGLAGLYQPAATAADDAVDAACVVLTTAANGLVEPVHERMPVIVQPQHAALWLDPDAEDADLEHLMRPLGDDRMLAYAVSRRVNDVQADDASCIEPAAPDEVGRPVEHEQMDLWEAVEDTGAAEGGRA